MTSNLRFSILIPVYNVENYLEQCLNSVLNQKYRNFEIILINDGSSDSSGEICESFAVKDNRIRLFNQTNQGLIKTRRLAISLATGDYILFLDSDDFWDLDLLESVNNVFCDYQCDMIIFKYRRVSEKGSFVNEPKSVFFDKTIFEYHNKELLFKEIISGSELNNLVCKAVNRILIDHHDYDQYNRIRNAEDLLQTLPLISEAKKIVYLAKAMYNYRISPTGISSSPNINFLSDVTTVRSLLLQYLRNLKMDSKDNLKLFYSFYISIVKNYMFNIINSDLKRNEKLNIIKKTREFVLFKQALNFQYLGKQSISTMIFILLMRGNHSRLLILYASIAFFIKLRFGKALFKIKGLITNA